jgi:hypothetical protein
VVDTINYSWQPPPFRTGNVLSASFKFEDSTNCGGSNGNVQAGTAECSIVIDMQTQIDLLIQGNVEGESTDFDHSWILISGDGAPPSTLDDQGYEFHCQIKSNQSGNLCQMFNTSSNASFILNPGTYTVYFRSDTFDGRYHANMVHNFQVTLTPT